MHAIRSLAAALVLVAAFAAFAAEGRPPSPPPEIAALREEIAALQVDRALALSPDQARALLPVLTRAAAEVQAARTRIESPDPALVAALARARDELAATGAVSDGTRAAVRAAERGRLGGRRGEGQAIRRDVMAILTPAQLAALRTVPLGLGPDARGAGPGGMKRAAIGGPGGAPRAGGAGPGAGRRLLLLGVLTSTYFRNLVEARGR